MIKFIYWIFGIEYHRHDFDKWEAKHYFSNMGWTVVHQTRVCKTCGYVQVKSESVYR
jgi:hypothetical protein